MEEYQEQPVDQALRAAELIFKYLREDLSAEEQVELDTWIESSNENRLLFSNMTNPKQINRDIEEFEEIDKNKRRVHEKLMKRLFANEGEKTKLLPKIWKYLAAAGVILVLGAIAYWALNKKPAEQTPSVVINLPADVSPGGKKALLQVDGGQLMDLTRDVDSLFQAEGTHLTNQDGRLVYDKDHGTGQKITYHTIMVPNGGEYQLKLSDGTKVWMNSASTLRYPTQFTGSERRVELTGEAYFEVAASKEKPFIVNVDSMFVRVTGTEFNINAYKDETLVKSTLFEGKVKISKDTISVDLVPGQQLQLDRRTSDVRIIPNADLEAASAWKDGLFKLTSADIPTIMRQIARWYDIEVVYKNSVVPQGHITGTIPRNLNLSDILKVLEASGVHFEYDGKKLTVLP